MSSLRSKRTCILEKERNFSLKDDSLATENEKADKLIKELALDYDSNANLVCANEVI